MTPAPDPKITAEIVKAHGLKPEEYERFVKLLGRAPSFTELGICSAMWNEHCSYKSSKKWLRTLPTKGPRVIQGPGENAGVVDVGDGQAIVFKMESHNHPSFIEPYQGSATGVGGILRDVFTMGARPIAASFGVPTIGGEVNFHGRYNGNILVNAMAVGLADTDKIFYSKARGVGLPVVYLGAKTGRDGIHGATMASAEFAGDAEDKRPTVQVGDPFTEKCLLEACLELMASGAVIAIQDMGAAGLTSSAVEMGAKGDLGIELDLDKVPCREEAMTAYEMMLSESQERMLMVLDPAKEKEAEAIFHKWGLDFAIVGKTTDTLRFVIRHQGEVKADLPIKQMGDEAPEYDRHWIEPPKLPVVRAADVPAPKDLRAAILKIVGSPDMSSRRWVWEQYDHLIQSNTAQIPGGDAGVIRIGPNKAIAATTDVTPRYVEADPFEGGKQAVAECWRNLVAVGATPIAITDNLNFGNPERPEIMGQFVMAVRGIGEACRALNFPVVSGNVSLYNETMGQAILPTPAIGGIGLLDDLSKMTTLALKQPGDVILLIGGHGSHLGQSIYLREVLGREEGAPPPVDLAAERCHGNFVRDLINARQATAVHDVSDGGLGLALIEMGLASGLGARLDPLDHVQLFAEDQSRYVVTCATSAVAAILGKAAKAGIDAMRIGEVTADARLIIGGAASISLGELRGIHEGWFPAYMAGEL
ncbi:MAG: phosphoribosylformylglycinamidine synthase subunit PurL [Rhizobiales bacterium]|nr:phosphoribosylformylglycinamidine synthase subunit PurL [Hyphomicrobiales bacterium]